MPRSFQPVTHQTLSLKRIDKVRGLLGIGMAIVKYERNKILNSTAQKMKFSIKDFFSKCDQIRRKLQIWSHLLKKSLMENFIFCAV